MKRRLLLVIALAASAAFAQAQAIKNPISAYTGNEYRRLQQNYKSVYVLGVFDGFLAAQLVGAPYPTWLANCINGKESAQIVAIVDRWMDSNPERWDQQMNVLALVAMRESCAKR